MKIEVDRVNNIKPAVKRANFNFVKVITFIYLGVKVNNKGPIMKQNNRL